MGNFRRLLRQSGQNWTTFEKWMRSGQGKRELDAYEQSLRQVEIAEAELEAWVMRHVDDRTFETEWMRKRKRIEALQAASLERLKMVFNRFRKDVKRKP